MRTNYSSVNLEIQYEGFLNKERLEAMLIALLTRSEEVEKIIKDCIQDGSLTQYKFAPYNLYYSQILYSGMENQ
jgi:hypothetical protein